MPSLVLPSPVDHVKVKYPPVEDEEDFGALIYREYQLRKAEAAAAAANLEVVEDAVSLENLEVNVAPAKKRRLYSSSYRDEGTRERVDSKKYEKRHDGGAKVKLCSSEGCTSKVYSGGVCKKHVAEVKQCSREGCTNYAQKGGVCTRHGASEVKQSTVHAFPPRHKLLPPSPSCHKVRPKIPFPNVMEARHIPPAPVELICVPMAMAQPIPSRFQGDITKNKDASLPFFCDLVNFPCYTTESDVSVGTTRNCVMCGNTCLFKTKSSSKEFATIPCQNKGVCSDCDVKVWIILESGQQIKWCKGCKNFRPWAAFGTKGLATKCIRCRERQRAKYASMKMKKLEMKTKKEQE